jgi:hypothetical protein
MQVGSSKRDTVMFLGCIEIQPERLYGNNDKKEKEIKIKLTY